MSPKDRSPTRRTEYFTTKIVENTSENEDFCCAVYPCQYGQEMALDTIITQETASMINAIRALTREIVLSIENSKGS